MPLRLPPARWLAASFLALSFAAPAPALAATGEVGCADVDVLVIRGSSEPSGSSLALDGSGGVNGPTGVWTFIRKEMQTPTDGSTPIGQIVRTDVDYPADLPFPSSIQGDVADSTVFRRSVRLGTFRVITYLNSQAQRCPNKRYVLLGYSQGAIVAANAVTPDTNKRIWIDNVAIPALDPGVATKVAALGLFADVGFNQANGWAEHATTAFGASAPAYLQGTYDDLNRGWNDGNSSHITTAPQVRDVTALPDHQGKVRSYCIQNDFICQGTGGLSEHLYYMDAGLPGPRKNLAIFVVQQLRNQVDKTYANAQCTFTQATDPAIVGMGMSLSLRFQASVVDRAVAGGNNTTSKLRATVSYNGNQASLLKVALGNPGAISKTKINLPVSYRQAVSGVTFSQTTPLDTYNDTVVPLGSGFSVGLPGGSQANASPSADWLFVTAGPADLLLGSTFTVTVDGQGGGNAVMSCNLNNQASTAFGGRHFGRIAVGW